MDENVAKAVAHFDGGWDQFSPAHWQTIRARLVELEAENERLLADCDLRFKQAMQNGQSAQEQRARAEKAEALLRECFENREGLAYETKLIARITAHLSENSRG